MNKIEVDATPFVLDSSGNQQTNSFDSSGITKKLGYAIAQSQCFIEIFLFGFNRAQMIQLQGVCKIFYVRVAEWMKIKTIYRHINIRRSEVACFSNKKDLKFIEFPTETMVDDWCGIPPILIGF